MSILSDLEVLHNATGKGFKFIMAAAICAAFLAFVYITGSIYPFSPYEFNEYTIVPDTVCPGQPIAVSGDIQLYGGPYDLTYQETDAYWVYNRQDDLQEADRYGNVYFQKDIEAHGPQNVSSKALRVAPPIPGNWKLGADVVVHGRMFGIVPRVHEVEVLSDKDVLVLPPGSGECSDFPLPKLNEEVR